MICGNTLDLRLEEVANGVHVSQPVRSHKRLHLRTFIPALQILHLVAPEMHKISRMEERQELGEEPVDRIVEPRGRDGIQKRLSVGARNCELRVSCFTRGGGVG